MAKDDAKDDDIVGRLGYKIRAERVKMNYSQEDLAEKAGLHKNYIGMVERGEKNVTVLRCYQIARALKLSLMDLVAQVE